MSTQPSTLSGPAMLAPISLDSMSAAELLDYAAKRGCRPFLHDGLFLVDTLDGQRRRSRTRCMGEPASLGRKSRAVRSWRASERAYVIAKPSSRLRIAHRRLVAALWPYGAFFFSRTANVA